MAEFDKKREDEEAINVEWDGEGMDDEPYVGLEGEILRITEAFDTVKGIVGKDHGEEMAVINKVVNDRIADIQNEIEAAENRRIPKGDFMFMVALENEEGQLDYVTGFDDEGKPVCEDNRQGKLMSEEEADALTEALIMDAVSAIQLKVHKVMVKVPENSFGERGFLNLEQQENAMSLIEVLSSGQISDEYVRAAAGFMEEVNGNAGEEAEMSVSDAENQRVTR